ncbi:uncharacterized protein BO87DRAFT_458387 [Aspergillus neoniger CBS 115656]|uniref:Uncharacterized protein n=1 Tax=Aspergillus neoniger (strain CBS 115656) TaxID=1448310 RepID=A0A318YKN0_ASPNB|nr:hypothetical protein BO87DRAFT_458387 [Aspergillus neoniger CBS 115656]PYH35105.1 hypothetical protein BO87DRAFT_458387 [Aspergillus neoniger CBS 115656]
MDTSFDPTTKKIMLIIVGFLAFIYLMANGYIIPRSPESIYIAYTSGDMSGLMQGIEGALQQGYRVQVIFDRV